MEEHFMKTMPVFRLLLTMSVPAVLSMLMQSLYNIVDSMWVARLGTDALTAVSLAFPLQNAIVSAGVGVGIGIGALISMNLGAGERARAEQTAAVGLALVAGHCVLFFLAGRFLTAPFLSLFTDDPQIFGWACDYTHIVMMVSFGALFQLALEKIFQAVGRMKTMMVITAASCLFNIVLDPILIFGWLGAPQMGVKGAAIATVLSQILAMTAYALILWRRDIGVKVHRRALRFEGAMVGGIYGIGIPSTLTLAMPSVLTGVLNGMLGAFGSLYIAVFGLYFKLQSFINLPANGVIQGMRPIVSYNYGACEYRRVKAIVRAALALVFGFMVVGSFGALVFPRPILSLFDADALMMDAGVPALRILGVGFVLSTVSIVTSGVLEALGRGKASLVISFLRQLVIVVPLGAVLSRWLGATGIWLAFPMAEAVTLVWAARTLRKLLKEHLAMP